MTKEEWAAKLTGRQYRHEFSGNIEEAALRDDGLVAVFGASDDLMEFRGAIDDEQGAPGFALVDAKGLLPERSQIDNDDDEALEDFFTRRKTAKKIEALWCKEKGYSFTYKTDIPHATFEVMEDGDHYCRGIVFAFAEL